MPTNDNDHTIWNETRPAPDAHGHAALLLIESLIHGLCDSSALSTAQAVEIADRAVSVQLDHADAADGAGAPMWRSHALLASIAASLRIDNGAPPRRSRP